MEVTGLLLTGFQGGNMIHQTFATFLTLLIVGLIAAAVIHVASRYQHMNNVDGFFCKWIAAYLGAWVGQPVLGYWGRRIAGVHWIPALVAAFAGAFAMTATWKAHAKSLRLAAEIASKAPRPMVETRAA
jgi:uncharacterized membrane protein YeaQ/YmgE (transglycosylase-associated protein family)